MPSNVLFLSLGSNLGDRRANLESAIGLIGQMVGTVVAASDFIETSPWGFDSENAFLNAAVKVETALSPLDALRVTQDIERRLGRTAGSKRQQGSGHSTGSTGGYCTGELWGGQNSGDQNSGARYHDRTIDIDLLLYFDSCGRQVTVETPELTLPHPLMYRRDFVMVPLRQIASDLNVLTSAPQATLE